MNNETNKNNQNTSFFNCCNSDAVAPEIIINETDIAIKIEHKNQSTQTQQDDKYLNKKNFFTQKKSLETDIRNTSMKEIYDTKDRQCVDAANESAAERDTWIFTRKPSDWFWTCINPNGQTLTETMCQKISQCWKKGSDQERD